MPAAWPSFPALPPRSPSARSRRCRTPRAPSASSSSGSRTPRWPRRRTRARRPSASRVDMTAADERAPFEHEKRIEIRWRDLDTFGHVNHVVFLTYLEEARDEWLGGALGDPDRAWDWVVAHVEIDYRRELVLADDMVVAVCRLDRIGNSSVTTQEQI